MDAAFTDSDILGRFTGEREAPNFQREAVARLTTACESIIQRGLLDAEEEFALRTFTNVVCNAFSMAPVQETERMS